MSRHSISKIISVAALSVVVPGGAAFAACDTSLSKVDQALDQKARSQFGREAQDARRLRSAAALLADYNKDGACAEVMAAIKEIVKEPRTASGMSGTANAPTKTQGGGTAEVREQTVTRKEKAANAKLVLEANSQLSIENMNGATVYSSVSGNTVGEIEDVIIGQKDNQFAVLAHGGFLGLGEKRVKVPLSAIKVNLNDNSYYVSMTGNQIESAAGVEWKNGQWVGEPVTPKSSQ